MIKILEKPKFDYNDREKIFMVKGIYESSPYTISCNINSFERPIFLNLENSIKSATVIFDLTLCYFDFEPPYRKLPEGSNMQYVPRGISIGQVKYNLYEDGTGNVIGMDIDDNFENTMLDILGYCPYPNYPSVEDIVEFIKNIETICNTNIF